jgi:molybdopterin molybdotransferase
MRARASLAAITAWIESNVERLGDERVAPTAAGGRVAAAGVAAPAPLPAADAAAIDGVALTAAATVGASTYNPLSFRLITPDSSAMPGDAVLLAAGQKLPRGLDAVVPLDQVERDGDVRCAIVEPIEPGHGVDRAGAHIAADGPVVEASRPVRPAAVAALIAFGYGDVAVVRQPRVRVVVARHDGVDADGALLAAVIARDGGVVEAVVRAGCAATALAAAIAAPGADLVLVVGGTGPGPDDAAAAALASAGTCAIHGVALRPCETAGLGRAASGTPVFLLPGAPAACLWAYELIAGAALRRRGGRPMTLPFAARRLIAARKIVSAIGMVDVCPVSRIGDDRVEPIVSFEESGLGAALRADGVVIVPEGSEGHARDSTVLVYLFEP